MINPKNVILIRKNGLVVVNKPAGIPSQDDLTGDQSVHKLVSSYLDLDLHLINRLDRPVSGLLLMAENSIVFNRLQSLWHSPEFMKIYIAIVEGKLLKEEGELIDYIGKSSNNKAIAESKGKKATLKYKVLCNLNNYSILEIQLGSGRFHQIRFQLANLGHPIKGDVKYGARRKNKDRTIHLHCYRIIPPEGQDYMAPLPVMDNLWKITREVLIDNS